GAIGAVATVGIGATQVIGADMPSIKIDINAEAEYVTLTNTGDSEVDLSDYRIDLEYSDQTTQDQSLEDNTVIPAGDSIRVGTGSKTEGDVDQSLGYDKAMLNNENPDVVALLNTDGDVVAKSNDSATDETTTTEEDDTTEDSSDETTTEEETTTENDSDESTSEKTTDDSDDSESSGDSSDDTQSDDDTESDESENSGSDDSEDAAPDNSSSEEDSQDDC
ncbi:lamin tail domain-containing protein, partial [Haladaptatus sp. W1]